MGLVFLALSISCSFSKPNTISLCIRSICSVLQGYSVELYSLLCTEVLLLPHSFVKQLRTNLRTMDINSAKRKRRIILLRLMATLGDSSSSTLLLIIVAVYISSWQYGPSLAYGLPLWGFLPWLSTSTDSTSINP